MSPSLPISYSTLNQARVSLVASLVVVVEQQRIATTTDNRAITFCCVASIIHAALARKGPEEASRGAYTVADSVADSESTLRQVSFPH